MTWAVEFTDEFGAWYTKLADAIQDDIDRVVGLLEAKGPQLPFPYSSGIAGSRHGHMRSSVQSGGAPYRIFYAFDPRRTAILLIGGGKAGHDRFYETMVPIADDLYEEYLIEIGEKASMTGHRAFGELRQAMSPERRTQNAEATQTILKGLALEELRQARTGSQAELARDLEIGQPAINEIEQRTDMYVDKLRGFVEALGGKLEITAKFPSGSVTITSFGGIDGLNDHSTR